MNMDSFVGTRPPEALLKMFRTRLRPGKHTKLTQQELAVLLERDPRTLRQWESGVRLPSADSLQRLILAFIEERIFIEGQEEAEARLLWESVRMAHQSMNHAKHPTFDEQWFASLMRKRQQPASRDISSKTSPQYVEANKSGSAVTSPEQKADRQSPYACLADWGEALEVHTLYGREQEFAQLEHWIMTERCRLITIGGMGGIGKSSLAVTLARQVQPHFDFVLWRSLRNAPALEDIITDCILLLSQQEQTIMPKDISKQIALLLSYLRTTRCLLVFDNVEAILQGSEQARSSSYREGYEGYGTLWQLLGETTHQSCVLLTSREKPKEVAMLAGKRFPVRSFTLAGLGVQACRTLLNEKTLRGSEQDWQTLISIYAGNPLALQLVSDTIQEVFGGNILTFLAQRRMVFGDIRDLLDQQFARLSPFEKGLLYWLTIEREQVPLETLLADVESSLPDGKAVEALDALVRRSSWIERGAGATFTLQPVLMEYVTDRLIEQVCLEIAREVPEIVMSHTLMKAHAKDEVRNSQIQLILKVVAGRLLITLGQKQTEKKLVSMLTTLREQFSQVPGYMGANALHLLSQLHCDLRGWDFSHLTMKQAYLRNLDLREVNFAHADLASVVFTETFSNCSCVAFSPDGRLLAAGTTGGEIYVWDNVSRAAFLVCVGHSSWVRSVAFSPDNTLLASSASDRTIRLWNMRSGQCLRTLHDTHWVASVAFSPNGLTLANAGFGTIKLWDVHSGQLLSILPGHNGWVESVAFSPNGLILASASYDQTIKLWDTQSLLCLHTLEGHTHPVRSLSFSPDGSLLVSCSNDQTIKVWDVNSRQCLRTLQGHCDKIRSVTFSPDGSLLASGSDDQTIKLWDANSGQCLYTLLGHSNDVWSVTFSPDSSLLASGAFDQTIKLWDVNSGECLRTLQGYTDAVWSIAFSPDGFMLASGSENQMVQVWDIHTDQCLSTLQGHSDLIRSVAFNPDSSLLASGGNDQTIKLWNIRTGLCYKTFLGHSGWVRSVTFSPDGSLLASSSDDQTIKLWNIHTGLCCKTLLGHTNYVWSTTFSPNGDLLASGGYDETVKIWNVHNGQCQTTLQGHRGHVYSVAFSPDGSLLASCGSDHTIKLWDLHTNLCLHTLLGHSTWVRSIAIHPHGSLLASCGSDHTIKLWDLHTGLCLHTLLSQDVRLVAFSPDGTILASSCQDATITLWNLETYACLKKLRGERPYECMNISRATGLTEAQKASLKTLGATEYPISFSHARSDTSAKSPRQHPIIITSEQQYTNSKMANTPKILMHPVVVLQTPSSSPPDEYSTGSLDTLQQLLRKRELQVLQLISQGASTQQIAQQLMIATSTIKSHLKAIYSKLHVHSRTQAIARARQLHIL